MSRGSALRRSDAFDQQRELRMKEGWIEARGCEEKDSGMRALLRMAMVMIMDRSGVGEKTTS